MSYFPEEEINDPYIIPAIVLLGTMVAISIIMTIFGYDTVINFLASFFI